MKKCMTKIKLERLEGRCPVLYEREEEFTRWKDANNALRHWAITAPQEGYDKVRFVIEYEDGFEYEGRFDLERKHFLEFGDLIGTHMKKHLKFCIERVGGSIGDKAREFLENYVVGEHDDINELILFEEIKVV